MLILPNTSGFMYPTVKQAEDLSLLRSIPTYLNGNDNHSDNHSNNHKVHVIKGSAEN